MVRAKKPPPSPVGYRVKEKRGPPVKTLTSNKPLCLGMFSERGLRCNSLSLVYFRTGPLDRNYFLIYHFARSLRPKCQLVHFITVLYGCRTTFYNNRSKNNQIFADQEGGVTSTSLVRARVATLLEN